MIAKNLQSCNAWKQLKVQYFNFNSSSKVTVEIKTSKTKLEIHFIDSLPF